MWRLILANLRYQLRPALIVCALCFGLAAAANVVLPLLGIQPPPEDDFKLAYFFPVAALFAALIVAFGAASREAREGRLLLHSLLPRSRRAVGAARVLTPAIFILVGLAVAQVLMFVVELAVGVAPATWRHAFLCFFAGQFLVLVQIPILVSEGGRALRESPLIRIVFLSAVSLAMLFVLLRQLSRYVAFHPALARVLAAVSQIDPESFRTSVLMFLVAAALCGLSYVGFLKRRCFTE